MREIDDWKAAGMEADCPPRIDGSSSNIRDKGRGGVLLRRGQGQLVPVARSAPASMSTKAAEQRYGRDYA